MNDNSKRFYFSIVKLLCIITLIVYIIYYNEKALHVISMEWFLLAVALFATLGFELSGSDTSNDPMQGMDKYNWKCLINNSTSRWKLLCLGTEIIIVLVLFLCFSDKNTALYLYPMVLMDTIVFLHFSFVFGIFMLLGVLVNKEDVIQYTAYSFFIFIIYFQNFIIIERYKKYIDDYEEEEYQLKDSIHMKDTKYREQLEKSSLAFENRMLEEKTRLSQALHDKLGHSINGSVYQLEACKVLMEKDSRQSKDIMQGVIDNLRASMDEIRQILRKEKPDKKRMAYLQLVQLCEECKEKYGILARVTMEGEDKDIPEHLWDVILDNTVESVTNALKYAKCSELTIEIAILHKVVRCMIRDNGIGCVHLEEGMGIQGMKSRTRRVNGFLDINCENGFHINMIIPL